MDVAIFFLVLAGTLLAILALFLMERETAKRRDGTREKVTKKLIREVMG